MMKQYSLILIAVFGSLLLLGCNGQSQSADTDGDSVAIEKDTLSTDTISLPDALTEMPPKVVDELFDDFIYNFMRNSRFQCQRIAFPIKHVEHGVDSVISSSGWKHKSLYASEDLYMSLFYTRQQMRLAHDTSVESVIVQDVNIEEMKMTDYFFARHDGLWRLYKMESGDLADESIGADSEFMAFFCRFAKDEEFQKNHVQDPFHISTFDDDQMVQVNGDVEANDWTKYSPVLPIDHIVNVNYGQKNTNKSLRIVNISSSVGDAGVTMTFKKLNGEWMLTAFDN